MTDAELVALARQGETEAFARLYDRYARLVRAIAYDAAGTMATADDITQEVFLTVFRKLHQLRDEARFASWLVAIARRAAQDWRRSAARDRHEFGLASEPADAERADTLEGRVDELFRAIRQLPEDERLALHLYYLEEKPAELARELLGVSQSGFYKLLERARAQTAAIMRKNEEASR